MRLNSIDHILRSAAAITGHSEFVIVGSAAIIARLHGNVPEPMTLTPEVDIYAFKAPNLEDLSDLIDGSIGQDSQFHATFGYFADGVSPETSKMPADWLERAIRYESPGCLGALAIVPEENDIALAKMVAWREKDIAWLKEGVSARVLSLEKMRARIPSLPPADPERGMPAHHILKERLRILAASDTR